MSLQVENLEHNMAKLTITVSAESSVARSAFRDSVREKFRVR